MTSSDRKELESLLSLLKVKIDLTADSSESSEEEESKNKANGEKIILKLFCCSEYTVWKIYDFSASHILREIKFGQFRISKTVILSNFHKLEFSKI